jgi:hypothetical protein
MKPAEPQAPLAPWLQSQLAGLMASKAHALLLSGPSGLGQYDLAAGTGLAVPPAHCAGRLWAVRELPRD